MNISLQSLLAFTAASTVSWPLLAGEPTRHGDEVLVHPFRSQAAAPQVAGYQSESLQLADGQRLLQNVRHMMEQATIDQRVTIQRTRNAAFNAYLAAAGFHSETYHFTVDNIPLCQFEVKAHQGPDDQLMILGKLPDSTFADHYAIDQWPLVTDSVALSEAFAQSDKNIRAPVELLSREACLWVEDQQAHRVWKLRLQAGSLVYDAIADDHTVYQWQPGFFHVTGSAQVYDNNPIQGELTNYNLRSMEADNNGGCFLKNTYFQTQLYDEFANDPAYATDCNFVYSEGSSEFAQTSLFTNANRQLEWLEEHGYTNFGDTSIRIVVHKVFTEYGGNDINNALYQPTNGQAGSTPTIYVGDGDGQILQNLAIDSDVVSHELGHHVVYHTIKNISDESLVVHEALADFFTFSRTGDSCLGESICPSDSPICAKPTQCLRTADNDLNLQSPDLPNQPHLRSQFLSGLLWDLRTKDSIPAETMTQLVLKAINLFVQDSGYQHFILGLLFIDYTDYDGQYCKTIYDRALARGMETQLSGISCDNISDLADNGDDVETMLGNSTTETTTTSSQSRSSKSSTWCGNIGMTAQGSWPLALFLGLPLIALFWRKRP